MTAVVAAALLWPSFSSASPALTTSLLGDVNCDKNINSVDAALILQFDAGLVASLACQDADVNGDGTINAIDAALVLQLDAGLLGSSVPPPSDDDLYAEVTRFGVTSSGWFYFYVQNQSPDWWVCDLSMWADVLDRRTGIWLSGSIVEVGDRAPGEDIEPGRSSVVPSLDWIDYQIVGDWVWC